MRRMIVALQAVSLVLALLLAGCIAPGGEAPTPTPLPAVTGPENVVFTVERGPIIAQRDFYGEVVPAKQESLFFRASGYITRVAVAPGDSIHQGDVLAELQIDDLLDQLSQARISLQVAQDNLSNARLQHAYDVQKAESDVSVAQIQVTQIEERLKLLYGSALESAQNDLLIAQERLRTAQAQLALVQGKQDTASQAAVDSSQLSVDRLERLITERQITAPYDGIVLTSYIKAGTDVDAFSTAFIVGDPSNLVIRIGFDAQMATVLEPSTKAFMSLTRDKKELHPVQYLPDFLPVTNPKSGITTSGSDISLNYFYFSAPTDLPLDQLPIGGGVTLQVVIGEKQDALLLPPAALRGSDSFKYVIVLEDDYHRRVEVVSVGLKGDKLWEVVANLKEGDQVLGP